MPARIRVAAMTVESAGLLVYRRVEDGWRVFLVHPGGPFWAKRDDGAWSIPKGELNGTEDALTAAKREFREETGQDVHGSFAPLPPCRLPSRKIVHAFAVEGDVDADAVVSNAFELEWPPRSGRRQLFPEIDRGAWFAIDEAHRKIQPGQLPLLHALSALLAPPGPDGIRPAP
jgi:predicted NUDIX family NTP pyrophosphohydrolase